MRRAESPDFIHCFLRLTLLLLLTAATCIRAEFAPKIQDVSASDITEVSANVTWSTDVPSSSEIIFVNINDGNAPYLRIPDDHKYVLNHRVYVPSLQPGTKYSIYVVSRDDSGASSSTIATPVSFTTLAAPTGGDIDYRLDTYGPKNVFAGSDLYFTIVSVRLGGPADHLYFNSIDGLPAGITAHLICRSYSPAQNEDNDCLSQNGRYFSWFGNDSSSSEPAVVRLRTSLDTPPGPYSATITTQSGGVVQALNYKFNVIAPPSTLSPPARIAAPPIPGLQKWQSAMVQLGKKWCDPNEKMLFGYEGQVWYYDGARAYFQISDYTGDPNWLSCGNNILTQYRDNDVIPRSGAIEGWRVFPHGMAMDYWRNGTAASLQAGSLLDTGSVWVAKSGSPSVYFVRETAYAVNAMVKYQQLTGQADWHLARAVDFLLGDVDCFTGSDPDGYQQSFYDGLVLESLIQYYELTQDARIPAAVKKMIDWLWDNAWDASAHKMRYNPLDVPGSYNDVSNNLVAPAFAWYWNVSGDDAYLARGDELFEHSLDEDISYSGKIFVQNYRWSFDYVRWRSGAPFSTTHPISNDPAMLQTSISNVRVTLLDSAHATIDWQTSAPTSAQIEYGGAGYTGSTDIDLNGSTSHSMTLSGLIPDTTYQFRIRGLNAAGNSIVSAGAFHTPAAQGSAARVRTTQGRGRSHSRLRARIQAGPRIQIPHAL